MGEFWKGKGRELSSFFLFLHGVYEVMRLDTWVYKRGPGYGFGLRVRYHFHYARF